MGCFCLCQFLIPKMGQNDEKIELKIENNQIWVSNFKKMKIC
jgi:hypothetical protein